MNRSVSTRRKQRVRKSRARISGTAVRPRLAVFRSNRHLQLQLIDDDARRTMAHASTQELRGKKNSKTEQSIEVGKLLAERAKKAKISSVVFDRRFYKYHGRVKAAAEGALDAGLKI